MRIRRVTTGLLLAAVLALGGATAATAAPAATATPASPHIAEGIFGPCTPIQDGQARWIGGRLYECVYVWGLGYYWVSAPSCPGARPVSRPATGTRC